jgi:hypothetical protein
MTAPLIGSDDGTGFGVKGSSAPPYKGNGVEGISAVGDGIVGESTARGSVGVRGAHTGKLGGGIAVLGEVRSGITAVKGQHGAGAGIIGDDMADSGVWGDSTDGPAVVGTSSAAEGILGVGTTMGVRGSSTSGGGVLGESVQGEGVRGISHSTHGGVVGINDNKDSDAQGERATAAGVFGSSEQGEGVHGETKNANRFVAGVVGLALGRDGIGPGVFGESRGGGDGVIGKAIGGAGVIGFHGDPALGETTVSSDASKAGVFGASENGAGVLGYSRGDDNNRPAVYAFGGLKAIALGKPLAGWFVGNVKVDGDIFLPGADCAEEFDIADAEQIGPGAVVVVDENGRLKKSRDAYNRKVAGVIAGAGPYKSAIIMDSRNASNKRLALALMGKVYCQVDAQYSAIEAGDLLTSSPTPGHAMKASDPLKAFGAVLGKALLPWSEGIGFIPILIALT